MNSSFLYTTLALWCLLIASNSASGQLISERLDWYDLSEVKGQAIQDSLSFRGASTWESDPKVPVYSRIIKLAPGTTDVKVVLRNPRVDEIESQASLSGFPLKEEWEVKTTMLFNRGEPSVEVSIIPFSSGDKASVRRLLAFDLEIQSIRGATKSALADFVQSSRLASGSWFRIPIAQDGVYRITYSYLQSLGLEMASLDPDDINIYGNDEGILPFQNSVPRGDDLVLKESLILGGEDGSFDAGDQLIFYARGPHEWNYSALDNEFKHTKHYFSDLAYCFIGIGIDAPARVNAASIITEAAVQDITSFDDYRFYENDLENVIKSGRRLVGEKFGLDGTLSFSGSVFNFENLELDEEVKLRSRLVAAAIGSSNVSLFSLSCNGNVQNISIQGVGSYVVARHKESVMSFTPSSGNLPVTISFDPGTPDAEGWVDFLAFNVRRRLRRTSTQLLFRDGRTFGDAGISRFTIENMVPDQIIWDVTDPASPKVISYDLQGNLAFFKAETMELRQYALFNTSNLLTPGAAVAIPNQNLHALDQQDMVILTATPFRPTAEKFAELHRSEGLTVLVVEPQEVYNEFSSGVPDITAVKWFMKMFYDRAGEDDAERPDYLMMIGDGENIQRNLDPASSIYLLSYQSEESNSLTSSYISDDYFGLLDDLESDGPNGTPDIGIGRLPVKSIIEAEAMFSKAQRYVSRSTGVIGGVCQDNLTTAFGDWRNRVVFVGDDEDGNIHMSQADQVAQIMNNVDKDYIIKKIYLDAYQQEAASGVERYPQAADDIRRSIQEGSLILSYTGHGGEIGWAAERILDVPTVQNFTNAYALPVLFTATCEFSRYDDPERTSAGELVLLNPDGGAISLLTTTRLVFSGENFQLSRVFYDVVMRKDDEEYTCPQSADFSNEFTFPNKLRMGDLMRVTKGCVAGVNKLNFSLLGDPALRINYPEMVVRTDSVLNIAGNPIDTIKALQRVTVVGHIEDAFGNLLDDFNGQVEPSVFDKEQSIQTLQNDGNNAFTYQSRDNLIYKGKATVSNGAFSYQFVVPKDISYQNGQGKIYYYGVSGDSDAQGSKDDLYVGGTDDSAADDDQGPQIELFLNDESFVDGGLTNQTPILLAKIFDDNGVNTVGNGIGHDITVILDENTSKQIVLNDFYEADLDSYQSGVVRYPFSQVEEGPHTLTFKVWDIYNNSTEKTLDFVVENNEDLVLQRVMNYPNPFTTSTRFLFEHNKNCESLEVQVQVFTVSGKLVKTISSFMDASDMQRDALTWDGRDEYGDRLARGVYMYRLKVVTPQGQKQEIFEKLVIL